jgi:hypothetical protein
VDGEAGPAYHRDMAECENCGAPDNGVDVLCKFCKQPIAKDALASAIACPSCRAPNRSGRTQCSSCSASLLVACVFCGHGTPASRTECERCGEAFAGAAERKQQREAEKLLGAVGSFVGNLVGANLGGGNSSKEHCSHDSRGSDAHHRANSDDDPPPMDT